MDTKQVYFALSTMLDGIEAGEDARQCIAELYDKARAQVLAGCDGPERELIRAWKRRLNAKAGATFSTDSGESIAWPSFAEWASDPAPAFFLSWARKQARGIEAESMQF